MRMRPCQLGPSDSALRQGNARAKIARQKSVTRVRLAGLAVRQATVQDLLQMQNTNLWCLPENYNLKYYF